MLRPLLLAALWCAIAATNAGAAAMTVAIARPHRPNFACDALRETVAMMTGLRTMDITPMFGTDRSGRVEYQDRSALVRTMTTSEGRADRRPLRIDQVWPIGKREPRDAVALYVVALTRERWYPERSDFGDPEALVPAGYDFDTSYWVAEFRSERVVEFREAPFMWRLASGTARLPGCGER